MRRGHEVSFGAASHTHSPPPPADLEGPPRGGCLGNHKRLEKAFRHSPAPSKHRSRTLGCTKPRLGEGALWREAPNPEPVALPNWLPVATATRWASPRYWWTSTVLETCGIFTEEPEFTVALEPGNAGRRMATEDPWRTGPRLAPLY